MVASTTCTYLIAETIIKQHAPWNDMLHLNIKTRQELCCTNLLATIETTLLALLPHLIFLYASARRTNTKLSYLLLYGFVFALVLVDALCSMRTLVFALLEFTRQLYSNLINLAMFLFKRIYDIDHLVKNLFNNRLAQFILHQ